MRNTSQEVSHTMWDTGSLELCGWALMLRTSLFQQVTFQQIFPSDFQFWYQDNYAAFQLERHGLRHALVRDAKVCHLFEQSHELIDPAERAELTVGAERVFRAKTQDVPNTNEPLLTIAIATLADRVGSCLPALVKTLDQQAQGKPVEILAFLDNQYRSLGAKRNALAELANGEFLAFVDDDDDVSDDYVETLLDAITQHNNVDCIVFDAWVTIDGKPDRICRYGAELDNTNSPQTYFRRPNHVACFRTEIVRRVPREDITFEEDTRWANAVVSHVGQQIRIGRILYYYRARSQHSYPEPPSLTPELSICILTVPSRQGGSFPALVQKIAQQADGKPVEILGLGDNKWSTIGRKRGGLIVFGARTFCILCR